MTPKPHYMLNKEFYIEFGKVAYAMMMADGEVQDLEKQAFLDLVRSELAPLESKSDEHGTDLAYYSIFSFETESEMDMGVSDAFNDFLQYLDDRNIQLTPEVKKACLKVLNKVARAYGRFTKHEHEIFDRFQERLNKYLIEH